ncbi:hypothetical protein CKK33_10970 [Mucilaginibacter sp. MD40]|uniref:hypothetical protein n=1 Tax=Mucilaginibacter sp. MD40 TaxID=2029590 RepID=UPI000BAC9ADC|nr:hypothetical protein [Mucilaginibacter sp. MD40]PAW93988.1 hypothetical protein CKK33_10970 [Mucilaginibacter sp. MD40]
MITLKKTLFASALFAFALAACQNQHADLNASAAFNDPDTLSYELAKQYVKNYAKHAGTVDSFGVSQNDSKKKKAPNTRAIWFSVDRLQKLVNKIKSEGGDGIRFYLATYDTIYPARFAGGHKPAPDYWGHNTLVLVSTKDSTNKMNQKYHRDYYTDKLLGNNGQPSKGFIVGAEPENRGELCPPPRDCNSVGATLIP